MPLDDDQDGVVVLQDNENEDGKKVEPQKNEQEIIPLEDYQDGAVSKDDTEIMPFQDNGLTLSELIST